jgi:hypothetical protein
VVSQNEVPEPLGAKTWRGIRTRAAARAAGGRWAVWVLRVVVWAILTGASLLLVRQVVAPSAAEVVDAALDARLASAVSEWPTEEARDAAVRVAADALALGEDGADAVGTVTAAASPATQSVEVVTPGRVEVHDEARATVYLAARVRTATHEPGEGEESGPQTSRSWRWLAVPVVYDGEVVAASAEGMVEVPPPAESPAEQRPSRELNNRLTAETRDVAAAFFAALTGESRAALDALTDGSIPPLSGDVELEELAAWRVAEPESRGVGTGRPQTLSAEADVVWVRPSGLVDAQTYAVELHLNGDRWQVAEIGPVHPVHRRD